MFACPGLLTGQARRVSLAIRRCPLAKLQLIQQLLHIFTVAGIFIAIRPVIEPDASPHPVNVRNN